MTDDEAEIDICIARMNDAIKKKNAREASVQYFRAMLRARQDAWCTHEPQSAYGAIKRLHCKLMSRMRYILQVPRTTAAVVAPPAANVCRKRAFVRSTPEKRDGKSTDSQAGTPELSNYFSESATPPVAMRGCFLSARSDSSTSSSSSASTSSTAILLEGNPFKQTTTLVESSKRKETSAKTSIQTETSINTSVPTKETSTRIETASSSTRKETFTNENNDNNDYDDDDDDNDDDDKNGKNDKKPQDSDDPEWIVEARLLDLESIQREQVAWLVETCRKRDCAISDTENDAATRHEMPNPMYLLQTWSDVANGFDADEQRELRRKRRKKNKDASGLVAEQTGREEAEKNVEKPSRRMQMYPPSSWAERRRAFLASISDALAAECVE